MEKIVKKNLKKTPLNCQKMRHKKTREKKPNLGRRTNKSKNSRNYRKRQKHQSEVCTRCYVRLQRFDEIALKKKDPKILRAYISLKRCDESQNESQDEDITVICFKPKLLPGKNKNSKK